MGAVPRSSLAPELPWIMVVATNPWCDSPVFWNTWHQSARGCLHPLAHVPYVYFTSDLPEDVFMILNRSLLKSAFVPL